MLSPMNPLPVPSRGRVIVLSTLFHTDELAVILQFVKFVPIYERRTS